MLLHLPFFAQTVPHANGDLVTFQYAVIATLCGVVVILARRLYAASTGATKREQEIQEEKLAMKEAQIADRNGLQAKLLAMHSARVQELTADASQNVALGQRLAELERQIARGKEGRR